MAYFLCLLKAPQTTSLYQVQTYTYYLEEIISSQYYPENPKLLSFDAALLSKNHNRFPELGLTICAGRDGLLALPIITICTVLALFSPVITTATFEAEFITGRVKVILSGGGFGESVRKVTHSFFSPRASWPGKREATCPSGPIPRRIRSNFGQSLMLETPTVRVLTSCLITNS